MNKINRKILIVNTLVMAVLSVAFSSGNLQAQAQESSNSEMAINDEEPPDHSIEAIRIDREESLRQFFIKHNSPLIDEAETFVAVADKYDMDYRMLPAISGVESTFCKHIIPGTYNCYGWGIYGNNVIGFESYSDGIEQVAKGLYEGYVIKGADTPAKIAPIYNPNTPQHWSGKVYFFMNQIESTQNI